MISWLLAPIVATAPMRTPAATPSPLRMSVEWIHGSENCAADSGPALQVHEAAEDLVILRQNKCLNYEAPFIYLIFGKERVLMLDTGATRDPSTFPIAETVGKLMENHRQRHGLGKLSLIVAHTHGHGDHVAGDDQFRNRAETLLVGRSVNDVIDFFGLREWPEGGVTVDLGSKRVLIFPIPGHETASIAVYDPDHQAIFTGDTLYPGRLYVHDFQEFKKSVERLKAFSDTHPIQYVLGAHIEMSSKPGVDYPIGTKYQPDEHRLELGQGDIDELAETVRAMSTPRRAVRGSFIVDP